MKPRWTQSRAATQDLFAIRKYTKERWGAAQAKAYLSAVRDEIERAARHPNQRRSCGEELAGYFRLPVGSHVVFYRERNESIHVERILHQRMDVERHLT